MAITGGTNDIAMIASTIMVKLFWTNGIFPKKKPARQNNPTQMILHTKIKENNRTKTKTVKNDCAFSCVCY